MPEGRKTTFEDLEACVQRMGEQKPWERGVEKVYNYVDLDGEVVHQTVRFKLPLVEKAFQGEDLEKAREMIRPLQRFAQRRPNEEGGYRWSLREIEPVLYNLPAVQEAEGEPVVVVEGEKDADTLIELGIVATTCPMGANSWKPQYTEALRGKAVVIIGDNDEAGQKHVKKVAERVYGVARSVKEVKLTDVWEDAPRKADITDAVEVRMLDQEAVQRIIGEAREVEAPESPELVELPCDEILEAEGDCDEFLFSSDYGDLFEFTESRGVAKITLCQTAFAALYAHYNEILHHTSADIFYEYNEDTGAWEERTAPQIENSISLYIHDFARDNLVELENVLQQVFGKDPEKMPNVRRLLNRERTTQKLSRIVRSLKGIVGESAPFDSGPRSPSGNLVVHCENGMLEIDQEGQCQLRPFAPEYRSRFKSPIPYVEGAHCPKFEEQLVNPAVPREDDRCLLQRFLGLFLTSNNDAQKILLLRGSGGSGKGTWMEIAQKLVGESNCGELRSSCLAERFELGRLYNVSLACGSDVPVDFLTNEGAQRLKALTGDDMISCEIKGGNSTLHYRGTKFVVASANNTLLVDVQGDHDVSAWARRLVFVDFKAGPSDRKVIFSFAQHLMDEEGPGILNYAVEGLRRVINQRNEDGDCSLRMSVTQKERVSSVLEESRSVKAFVRDHLEKIPEFELSTIEQPKKGLIGISSGDLQMAYGRFCNQRSWIPQPSRTFFIEVGNEILQRFGIAKSNHVHIEGCSTGARYFQKLWIEPAPAASGLSKTTKVNADNVEKLCCRVDPWASIWVSAI